MSAVLITLPLYIMCEIIDGFVWMNYFLNGINSVIASSSSIRLRKDLEIASLKTLYGLIMF